MMNNLAEQQTTATTTFRIGDRFFTREELAIVALAFGIEKKAFRPVVLDLQGQGAFTEYFTILSASSGRQVSAIAEGIRLFFKHAFGIRPVTVDGLETQSWVLLDFGFLFVHVFQESTREMYALENLWSKGRLVSFTEESANGLLSEVRQLMMVEESGESAFAPQV
jgi:ribosome-associated protein